MAAAVQTGPEEGEVKVHLGSGVRVPPGEVGDSWRDVVGIEDIVAVGFKAELVFEGDREGCLRHFTLQGLHQLFAVSH